MALSTLPSWLRAFPLCICKRIADGASAIVLGIRWIAGIALALDASVSFFSVFDLKLARNRLLLCWALSSSELEFRWDFAVSFELCISIVWFPWGASACFEARAGVSSCSWTNGTFMNEARMSSLWKSPSYRGFLDTVSLEFRSLRDWVWPPLTIAIIFGNCCSTYFIYIGRNRFSEADYWTQANSFLKTCSSELSLDFCKFVNFCCLNLPKAFCVTLAKKG